MKPKIRKENAREWTKPKREIFFAELAATCNVRAAARAAGMSESGAYRRRQACANFRAQWATALSEGYAKLELMLMERALNGTVKTVTRKDGSIDKTHEYPNAIALSLLKQHRETAADAEHDPEEIEEARARIARKLDRLRARIEKERQDVSGGSAGRDPGAGRGR